MTSHLREQRRQARRVAVQCLYQLDVRDQLRSTDADRSGIESAGQPGAVEVELEFARDEGLDEEVLAYAAKLAEDTWRRRAELDERIQAASKHWELTRMTVVDRSILRMAIVEMLYREDPPEKVAIDEAIELGREFGTEESPQFINGILDAIRKRGEAAPSE